MFIYTVLQLLFLTDSTTIMCRFSWVWLWTQKGLIDNAKQGVGIVFALAFIVLNIATGNIIITVIAIFTVAGVVTTVLGLGISLIMGWDLGVAESIISVILIGFSMDYTLHLAGEVNDNACLQNMC